MENNELQDQIEAYFAALQAPLSDLPTPRRNEFLTEARAHLGAMVEARRADGLDETAAWNAALKDFGEPNEVGRALWKSWATSGQLEGEGEPLAPRDLARKYLSMMAQGLGMVVLLHFLPASAWHNSIFITLWALWVFGFLCRDIVKFVRTGGKWTPSVIFSMAVLFAANAFALFLLTGGAKFIGPVSEHWFFLLLLAFFPLIFFFYKRDLPNRPWRFGFLAARFKQSPVAAEQEYRLGLPICLAMGAVMGAAIGFSNRIALGLAASGFAPALPICAGLVVLSLGVGWWLRK